MSTKLKEMINHVKDNWQTWLGNDAKVIEVTFNKSAEGSYFWQIQTDKGSWTEQYYGEITW